MNQRNWLNYKNSKEGAEIISMFSIGARRLDEHVYRMFALAQLKGNYVDLDEIWLQFCDFALSIESQTDILKQQVVTRDTFEDFIHNLEIRYVDFTEEGAILTDEVGIGRQNFRALNSNMHLLSAALYAGNGSFFKPMLYQSRFDIIQSNCNKLGIELPEMPRTKDYSAYMMYYYDTCVAFQAFQSENHLSNAEFCACLYDYAETLGDDEVERAELPRPTNIWFVGASKADIKAYKEGKLDEETQIWQCNERTRRGDIIVLYALSPYSCIHSIWRAKSGGFFNPFDLYQTRTMICDCHELEHPISSKELQAHPYFSNVPVVRQNMQNINGRELTATDYQELLALLAQKGCDTSVLPHLIEATDWQKPIIGRGDPEKQVEEKILIPALEKLGYTSVDWTRQLSQKAGRQEKAIPDFVFFAKGENHLQNAPLVIEAKYDMSPVREYDKAFTQCLSYARMLQCKIMGICDENRLVLFKITKENYADKFNPIFEAQWAVINTDTIMFNKLQKLIGRTVVSSL